MWARKEEIFSFVTDKRMTQRLLKNVSEVSFLTSIQNNQFCDIFYLVKTEMNLSFADSFIHYKYHWDIFLNLEVIFRFVWVI